MGRNFGKQVSSLAFFQVVAVSEVMVIFPLEIRVGFSPKAHHDVGSPLSLFQKHLCYLSIKQPDKQPTPYIGTRSQLIPGCIFMFPDRPVP